MIGLTFVKAATWKDELSEFSVEEIKVVGRKLLKKRRQKGYFSFLWEKEQTNFDMHLYELDIIIDGKEFMQIQEEALMFEIENENYELKADKKEAD